MNKHLAKSKKEKASAELVVPMTREAFDACSKSGDFLDVLLTQTVNSSIVHLVAEDQRDKHMAAAGAALVGIQPNGELEGMLAAQLIACHNAAMECYRRAMNSQLPARDCHLNQANRLSRTYATLLEALNRNRGKGQQKVTVEHVHVHQGGQAIVGHVQHNGEGVNKGTEDQPRAKAAMLETPRCGAKTRKDTPCRSPAMPNGRCRMHGGKSPGAPKGNRNAWKHGHYSAEATAMRKLVRQLLSDAKDTVKRR